MNKLVSHRLSKPNYDSSFCTQFGFKERMCNIIQDDEFILLLFLVF